MELEQNYVPSSHTRHDRLKRRYLLPDLQAHYDDTMHITFILKTCRKMCTSTRSDVCSRVRLTGIFCRCHVRCRRTLYRWRVFIITTQQPCHRVLRLRFAFFSLSASFLSSFLPFLSSLPPFFPFFFLILLQFFSLFFFFFLSSNSISEKSSAVRALTPVILLVNFFEIAASSSGAARISERSSGINPAGTNGFTIGEASGRYLRKGWM